MVFQDLFAKFSFNRYCNAYLCVHSCLVCVLIHFLFLAQNHIINILNLHDFVLYRVIFYYICKIFDFLIFDLLMIVCLFFSSSNLSSKPLVLAFKVVNLFTLFLKILSRASSLPSPDARVTLA